MTNNNQLQIRQGIWNTGKISNLVEGGEVREDGADIPSARGLLHIRPEYLLQIFS